MVIRTKQTYVVPIINRTITKYGVLKPGSVLNLTRYSTEAYGIKDIEERIVVKALNPDSVDVITTETRQSESGQIIEGWLIDRVTAWENGIDRAVLNTDASQSHLKGKFGQDVAVWWESSLRPQARK